MENQLYTLFNTLSLRYGSVFAYPSDGFAVNELSKPLADGSHIDFEHLELCNIGSINIETGVVTSKPPKRIPWEIVPLPATEAKVQIN